MLGSALSCSERTEEGAKSQIMMSFCAPSTCCHLRALGAGRLAACGIVVVYRAWWNEME